MYESDAASEPKGDTLIDWIGYYSKGINTEP